ncbi:MAG: hypothetical protein ACREQP_24315, partial [Candidatus Binatia bacterium]
MNFTSPRIIFYLVLLFYLPLQLYLFGRLERVLSARIRERGRAKVYRRAALCFFILMFFPFLWIAVFGLLPHDPYPWPIRQDLLLLSIWAVGSTGSALVLLSYDLFKRCVRTL